MTYCDLWAEPARALGSSFRLIRNEPYHTENPSLIYV